MSAKRFLPLLALVACDHPDAVAPSAAAPLEDCAAAVLIPDSPAGDDDRVVHFDGPPPTSILFVVVDTLRRDTLPFYGSDRQTMPCLSGRGDHLVRFDETYATAPWTGPTTASLATGLWPEHHGLLRADVTADSRTVEDPITAPLIVASLQSAGWATALMSGNGWVSPATGFDAGFDAVNEDPGEWGHTESDVLGPATRDWLDTVPADQPFFVHLQLLDNHYPYLPRPEFQDAFVDTSAYPWPVRYGDEEQLLADFPGLPADDRARAVTWLRGLYDAETLAEDQEIEITLRALEDAGRLDDTLLVLTADHGETIDDAATGLFGHGGNLREELVHVPFLLYHPRLRPGVVTERVRGVDVLPTVLDALDLPVPDGLDGAPVRPGAGAPFAYGTLFPNDRDVLTESIAYVERDGIKVLRDCASGGDTAYDLTTDPLEIRPLDPTTVPGADALRADLDAMVDALQGGQDRYRPCRR